MSDNVVQIGNSVSSKRKQEILDYVAQRFDELTELMNCDPDDIACCFLLLAEKECGGLRHVNSWWTSEAIGFSNLHAASIKLSEELLEELYS